MKWFNNASVAVASIELKIEEGRLCALCIVLCSINVRLHGV